MFFVIGNILKKVFWPTVSSIVLESVASEDKEGNKVVTPMAVVKEKPWYRSRSMIAAYGVVVYALISGYLGTDIDASVVDNIEANASSIFLLVLGLLGDWGRRKAVVPA